MKNTATDKKRKLAQWFKVKTDICADEKYPSFSKGEVWWCSFGENVGVEVNGKGEFFRRPVLIFKKHNRHSFTGIPFTSQPHTGKWYIGFKFQNKQNYANLAQIKTCSVKRLQRRMGQLTSGDFSRIAKGAQEYYFGDEENNHP